MAPLDTLPRLGSRLDTLTFGESEASGRVARSIALIANTGLRNSVGKARLGFLDRYVRIQCCLPRVCVDKAIEA